MNDRVALTFPWYEAALTVAATLGRDLLIANVARQTTRSAFYAGVIALEFVITDV